MTDPNPESQDLEEVTRLLDRIEKEDPRGVWTIQGSIGRLLEGQADRTALWKRCAAAFKFTSRQWHEYGKHLLSIGDVADALAAFDRLLPDPEWHEKALRLKLKAHQTVENWPAVLATAEQAIEELSGKDEAADFIGVRAVQSLRANMIEDAIADYTRLCDLKPSKATGYLGLVKAHCSNRAFDAAYAVLNWAKSALPDEAAALELEGVIVREGGSQEELIEFTKRLVGSALPDGELLTQIRRLLRNRCTYFSREKRLALVSSIALRPGLHAAVRELGDDPGGPKSDHAGAVRKPSDDQEMGTSVTAVRRRSREAAEMVRSGLPGKALEEAVSIRRSAERWPSLPQDVSQLVEWLEVREGNAASAQARYWSRRRRVRIPDRTSELLQLTEVACDPDVLVLAQIRNEMPNLPSFLQHHRALGVRKFIVVDNASNDGSREFLAAQDDVELFTTRCSFRRAGGGIQWLDPIARRAEHRDTLCLRLDADERLVYPHCDRADLSRLWSYMRANGFDAIAGPLVDMFPRHLADVRSPDSHVALSRFFDFDVEARPSIVPPYAEITGGVRSRSLDGKRQTLGKVPGLRGGGAVERLGPHRCSPAALADISCALLHFRFRGDFFEKAQEEIARREYTQNAQEWTRYLELESRKDEDLRSERSAEYKSWHDLVELGLMRSSPRWEDVVMEAEPKAVSGTRQVVGDDISERR